MKKKLLFLVYLLFALGASAQHNVFFPTKQGTVQTFVQKNGKEKVTGYTRQTINNVTGNANNLTVDYTCEVLDPKMALTSEYSKFKCALHVVDGLVTFDLKDFAAPLMGTANGMKVEVTGTPPEISGKLSPGDKIKDANVLVVIDAGMMKIKSSIVLTNSACIGVENVVTPAGTFSCYKVVQDQNTTTMGMSVKGKSTAWYAHGVGMVRCESYNQKGKLLSVNELISVE